MTGAAASLFDILAIEDDPAILEFHCPRTRLPLWPLVRLYFLRLVISDKFYKETPLINTSRSALPAARMTKTLARTAWWQLTTKQAQTANILIRATGAGLQQNNGLFFNRLCDHFVAQRPQDTLVLEDYFDWQWPHPRQFDRVLYNTPWRMIDKIKTKFVLDQAQRTIVASMVTWLRQRSCNRLGWEISDDQLTWFQAHAHHAIAAAPIWYERYSRLLIKKQIKLLIAEEASYGGWLVCLIKAAKDLGIPTAEYQHGMVSAGHDAYNYAPALLATGQLRQCLPDFFLTYGSWWSEQINLPTQSIVVGNPHRASVLQAKKHSASAQRDILILGDGRETDVHLRLAQTLADAAPSPLRVVFRPHPHERHKFRSGTPPISTEFVHIDTHEDIYDSFRQADTVISELSTGLFEAAGIVKRVFVWETEKSKFALPSHPFYGFSTAQQAAQLLNSSSLHSECNSLGESIWASDWQSRYAAFLQRVGL